MIQNLFTFFSFNYSFRTHECNRVHSDSNYKFCGTERNLAIEAALVWSTLEIQPVRGLIRYFLRVFYLFWLISKISISLMRVNHGTLGTTDVLKISYTSRNANMCHSTGNYNYAYYTLAPLISSQTKLKKHNAWLIHFSSGCTCAWIGERKSYFLPRFGYIWACISGTVQL